MQSFFLPSFLQGLHTGAAYRGCIQGLHTGATYRGYIQGLHTGAAYRGCIQGLHTGAAYLKIAFTEAIDVVYAINHISPKPF